MGDRLRRPSLWPAGRAARSNRSPTITAADLKDYVRRVFARDTLKIAIVGDIDRRAAGRLVDKVFGGLPAKGTLTAVAEMQPQGLGQKISIDLDVPQSVLTLGGARHRAQRPGLHAGLRGQPRARRRLVLVAALSRGARGARPRLFGVQHPDPARSHGAVHDRHRHPRRPHRSDARSARNPKSAPRRRTARPRRSSPRRSRS